MYLPLQPNVQHVLGNNWSVLVANMQAMHVALAPKVTTTFVATKLSHHAGHCISNLERPSLYLHHFAVLHACTACNV